MPAAYADPRPTGHDPAPAADPPARAGAAGAPPDAPSPAIRRWLLTVYGFILLMVVVGGITRLTGSGLSMVVWQPLIGALPPLNEADWQAVFAQYQQTPQYLQVNHWMQMSDFKQIFFWEYLHRLLGRVIGLVFALPWLYFVVRRRLRGRLAFRAGLAFVLGGLQGALGWYMVKSGLVDVPAVSHYRLAAHLGLAFFVASYVLWIALDLASAHQRPARRPAEGGSDQAASAQAGRAPRGASTQAAGPQASQAPPASQISRAAVWGFITLLAVQIIWGAFMAGSRAGYLFATFPDLNGVLVPPAWLAQSPVWRNFVDNPVAIHFIHRCLAYPVALIALALAAQGWRRAARPRQRQAAAALALTVALQFILGVLTVIWAVPLAIATAHQGVALVLLSCALWFAHAFTPGRARA